MAENKIFTHPTAIVETSDIGSGTAIWALTHVMKNVSIGENCNVGGHCFVESGAVIGNNVTIKNGNMLWEGVTVEDGVFVGPSVIFTNDLHPRSPRLPQAQERYLTKAWLLPTSVKQGATLGAGAIILPGITIGEFAMIGAGAVVTKDVPPHALMLGNPAQRRGWVCQCGQPLTFRHEIAHCDTCGRKFVKTDEKIALSHS